MYTFSKAFTNLDAFRRYLETAQSSEMFKYTRHSETQTRSFTGTSSFAEASDLMRDGDTENAKKLKAASGTGFKTPDGDGVRVRRFSHVCGGAVNVPAMLMGLPKSMIQTAKIKYNHSKVLTVVYMFSAACDIDADEINRVSAELVNAVLGLEKKGYRVNLFVGYGARNTGRRGAEERVAAFVRIKDSAQYFDAKKIAYPLVNPSAFRRHFFRFIETTPGLKANWPSGYGYPVKDSSTGAELAREAGLNPRRTVTFYDLRRKTAPEIMKMLLD